MFGFELCVWVGVGEIFRGLDSLVVCLGGWN